MAHATSRVWRARALARFHFPVPSMGTVAVAFIYFRTCGKAVGAAGAAPQRRHQKQTQQANNGGVLRFRFGTNRRSDRGASPRRRTDALGRVRGRRVVAINDILRDPAACSQHSLPSPTGLTVLPTPPPTSLDAPFSRPAHPQSTKHMSAP